MPIKFVPDETLEKARDEFEPADFSNESKRSTVRPSWEDGSSDEEKKEMLQNLREQLKTVSNKARDKTRDKARDEFEPQQSKQNERESWNLMGKHQKLIQDLGEENQLLRKTLSILLEKCNQSDPEKQRQSRDTLNAERKRNDTANERKLAFQPSFNEQYRQITQEYNRLATEMGERVSNLSNAIPMQDNIAIPNMSMEGQLMGDVECREGDWECKQKWATNSVKLKQSMVEMNELIASIRNNDSNGQQHVIPDCDDLLISDVDSPRSRRRTTATRNESRISRRQQSGVSEYDYIPEVDQQSCCRRTEDLRNSKRIRPQHDISVDSAVESVDWTKDMEPPPNVSTHSRVHWQDRKPQRFSKISRRQPSTAQRANRNRNTIQLKRTLRQKEKETEKHMEMINALQQENRLLHSHQKSGKGHEMQAILELRCSKDELQAALDAKNAECIALQTALSRKSEMQQISPRESGDKAMIQSLETQIVALKADNDISKGHSVRDRVLDIQHTFPVLHKPQSDSRNTNMQNEAVYLRKQLKQKDQVKDDRSTTYSKQERRDRVDHHNIKRERDTNLLNKIHRLKEENERLSHSQPRFQNHRRGNSDREDIMRGKIQSLKMDNETTTQMLQELIAREEDLNRHIADLKEQLRAKEKDLKHANSQTSSASTHHFNQRISDLEHSKNAAQMDLNQKMDECRNLQSSLDTLKREKDELERIIVNAKEEIVTLMEERDDAKHRLTEMDNAGNQCMIEIENLRAENRRLTDSERQNKEMLDKERQRSKDMAISLRKENETRERILKQSIATTDRLEQDKAQLRERLNEKESQWNNSLEKIKQLQDEYLKEQDKNRRLPDITTPSGLDKDRQIVDIATTGLSAAPSGFDKDRQISALKHSNNALQKELNRRNEEYRVLKSSLDGVNQQKTNFFDAVSASEEAIESMRRQRDNAHAALVLMNSQKKIQRMSQQGIAHRDPERGSGQSGANNFQFTPCRIESTGSPRNLYRNRTNENPQRLQRQHMNRQYRHERQEMNHIKAEDRRLVQSRIQPIKSFGNREQNRFRDSIIEEWTKVPPKLQQHVDSAQCHQTDFERLIKSLECEKPKGFQDGMTAITSGLSDSLPDYETLLRENQVLRKKYDESLDFVKQIQCRMV